MGTEIFKEIKESERKSQKIIEKSEKDREIMISRANTEASELIENEKIKIKEKGEEALKKKESGLLEVREKNRIAIEKELSKVKKSADKNMKSTSDFIVKDII